jgi:hypothetical protein
MFNEEAEDRGAAFGLAEEEVSINDLKQRVDRLGALRAEYQAEKSRLAGLNETIEELEREIVRILEAAGLERFDGEEVAVFLREKRSVKVPRDLEARDAFFNYLREQGVFEELITVNAQTLNSWWKQEVEALRSKGLPEEIPGIGEVTTYNDIQVRKK